MTEWGDATDREAGRISHQLRVGFSNSSPAQGTKQIGVDLPVTCG
jgi:hypothetical protein